MSFIVTPKLRREHEENKKKAELLQSSVDTWKQKEAEWRNLEAAYKARDNQWKAVHDNFQRQSAAWAVREKEERERQANWAQQVAEFEKKEAAWQAERDVLSNTTQGKLVAQLEETRAALEAKTMATEAARAEARRLSASLQRTNEILIEECETKARVLELSEDLGRQLEEVRKQFRTTKDSCQRMLEETERAFTAGLTSQRERHEKSIKVAVSGLKERNRKIVLLVEGLQWFKGRLIHSHPSLVARHGDAEETNVNDGNIDTPGDIATDTENSNGNDGGINEHSEDVRVNDGERIAHMALDDWRGFLEHVADGLDRRENEQAELVRQRQTVSLALNESTRRANELERTVERLKSDVKVRDGMVEHLQQRIAEVVAPKPVNEQARTAAMLGYLRAIRR
jgi:hypothetical protein